MTPDESADSRSRVLPLVSDAGNRQLLVEWLTDHPSYEPVELADGLAATDFDVCILDSGAFQEHLDALSAKKSATEPVLLPYLLLFPDGKSDVIDTDAGQLADNVVTESVDEIVTLPIQQAELQWRLSALLRLREQSTTLRNRERELERQVDLFEKAQDIASVGAWEYDIDDEEGWWTEAVYRIHGLSEDVTASPESSLQQFHPDDRPAVKAAFETAVDDGEPYDVEARLVTGADDTRWVRTRGEPQYEDGEVVRIRGTVQDITERKERERNLQRIKQAVESAGHAIYITDPEGVIEYVNPAFEAGTGFAEEDVVGETPHVLTSGEMSDEYFADLWSTLRSGEVWEEEIVNRRKNGETYTAIQTIAPVTDGDDIHAFVAIHDDITERKQREERLTRRTKAVEEAPVGIGISDPGQEDNPLIYVNDAFVEMTGYSRAEILGSNCRFLQGDGTDPDRVASIRAAIDDEEPVSVELRNYRKDGTEFWNHLEVAPVENDAGEVVNWIGFQQDVTERKQRQEQLSVLDRVLRHNLRNDMNMIRGLAETIRSEATGEVADFAARIVEKSDQLVELTEKERQITALLQEDPEYEQFEVGDRLRTVVSTIESKHPDARINVDCPEGITVDATTRFEQAISELVTNAVVHSDSLSPEVTLSATQTAETVRIEIADDGPQIPEMERELLTGQTEETPLYHGSGLGLWLVKLLVTRSHGTITVEANTPTGNVVTIALPR
ncbi:PAS domain S-box protein [Halobacterium rubrum]|uniref:PAS domain S-box protein n=1 Tax=Halobacterium TaxID=2239 RepID=UPI001F3F5F0F|nr:MULTISPECIES: PAS domain S-box protein [Halobacterium]MDH5021185.1 PAS domain S-box protein [Halobacterium rubrum]